MPGRRWVALAVTTVLLAGCGSGAADKPAQLTKAQAADLVTRLEHARATSAAHDVAGTKAALDGFKARVAQLRRAGAMSDATAHSLRVGAARVLARTKADVPPPQPQAVVTQTTPAPAPLPPGQKKKHDKAGKHGKGHGKEGD